MPTHRVGLRMIHSAPSRIRLNSVRPTRIARVWRLIGDFEVNHGLTPINTDRERLPAVFPGANIAIALIPFIAALLFATSAQADSKPVTSKIDSLFADFNRSDAPGASVTVIQNEKVLLAKGYGFANVEERI